MVADQNFAIVEGSNDVDSNYDPSEFLMAAHQDGYKVKIQDDLAVSESDEEENKCDIKPQVQPTASEEEVAAPGDLWF